MKVSFLNYTPLKKISLNLLSPLATLLQRTSKSHPDHAESLHPEQVRA